MIIKNAKVLIGETFEQTDVKVLNGVITEIARGLTGEEVIDAAGEYLIPGLIDVHTHGCMGFDFSTATEEEIGKMCSFYISRGITSVAATTMTMDYEEYKKAAKTIANYMRETDNHNLIGINMEGPFISKEKKGAHDPQYIIPVSQEKMDQLQTLAEGNFLIVDVAPELPGAIDFIKKNKDDYVISVAHTTADYAKAMEAFEAGATQVTHLFNAMNGLGHRDPGVPGAAFDAGANVEMICDSVHINPTVMKMVFKMMGDQIVTISDSMSACGLTDGKYVLGGLQVFVKGNKATLENGTIAGSTTDILTAVGILVDKCGLSFEKAIACVTSHPARAIRKEDKLGSIEVGKVADLVILTPQRRVKTVFKNGRKAYEA